MAHTCNPSIWKAQTEALLSPSYPGLHYEFQTRLHYRVSPCLKHQNKKRQSRKWKCRCHPFVIIWAIIQVSQWAGPSTSSERLKGMLWKLRQWLRPIIPALRRQKDLQLKTSLGYVEIPVYEKEKPSAKVALSNFQRSQGGWMSAHWALIPETVALWEALHLLFWCPGCLTSCGSFSPGEEGDGTGAATP